MGGLTNLKIPEKSTIVIIIIVIILVIIILLSITISRHPPPYHVNNQFIADGSLNYSAGSLFAVSPLPKLYLHLFYTNLSMHRSKPQNAHLCELKITIARDVSVFLNVRRFSITQVIPPPLLHQVVDA